jgi:cell division protein FtsQ
MAAATRRKTADRSGRNSPRRSRSFATEQPLKPHGTSWYSWVIALSVVLAIGVLTVPNREAIGRYLNRPIETVRLGASLQRISEGEVSGLLAAYMHEGFFDIDVSGVKHSLESHPWIARAEVKRVWPHSLALNLVEEVAIARWGEKSLLNQHGQVFTPTSLDEMSLLPLLAGADGSEVRVMEQFQAMNQILFPSGLRIEQLTLSERNSWELQVTGGMRIVAGREEVRERLKRFVAIYDKRFGNDIADIEKVDLRYSNGFTIKKRQSDLAEVVVR